jgi:transmembrane sensor
VDVKRGQAFFQVMRDSKRRFRVEAGEAQVLAIGTEFDVYRRPAGTLITVVEGGVDVSLGEPPPITGSAGVSSRPLHLKAGQQVGIEAGQMWAQPMAVDVHAAMAWLQHQIVVQNRPLGEVAEEFNRYGHVLVEIDEPAVRAVLVSGRFDAYDTESFAKFLQSLEGVAVLKTATRIRVLSVPPENQEPPPVGR